MRWLTASLLLGVSACSYTCSDSDPAKTEKARSDEDDTRADDAKEPGRVELVSRGREPRAKLEVARWKGLQYRLSVDSDASFGAQGQAPVHAPTTSMDLRFEVTRGSGDPLVRELPGEGELRLIEERAVLEDVSLVSDKIPAPVLDQLKQSLEEFEGTTTRQLVAEDGEVVEMKTELVGGAQPDPKLKEALDEAWEIQRRFPFRLPGVPVGVGARWRFSEAIEFRGVRAIQVADLQLTGLTEQTAKIRLRIRHQAPRQEIQHPVRPDDVAMLEQYRGDGEGELLVDRLTAVTLQARYTTTASLRLSAYDEQGKQQATFVAVTVMRSTGEVLGKKEEAVPAASAEEP